MEQSSTTAMTVPVSQGGPRDVEFGRYVGWVGALTVALVIGTALLGGGGIAWATESDSTGDNATGSAAGVGDNDNVGGRDGVRPRFTAPRPLRPGVVSGERDRFQTRAQETRIRTRAQETRIRTQVREGLRDFADEATRRRGLEAGNQLELAKPRPGVRPLRPRLRVPSDGPRLNHKPVLPEATGGGTGIRAGRAGIGPTSGGVPGTSVEPRDLLHPRRAMDLDRPTRRLPAGDADGSGTRPLEGPDVLAGLVRRHRQESLAGAVSQQAVFATPAPMATVTRPTSVISGLLSAVGLGEALVPDAPTAPADTPVLWGVLGWVRRQFADNVDNRTPATTAQRVDITLVADETTSFIPIGDGVGTVEQELPGVINAPVQLATGRSLIGNGGEAVPIYEAIQQANEQLLIAFTNVVGWFQQPLVPYFEQFFGSPVTPPVALPDPINGAVSLILSGTGTNVPSQDLLADIAQQYSLPGGFGAVWQPNQVFPFTLHLGNLTTGQSISQGVQYLDQAIQAEVGNNITNITVWTVSLSAMVATGEIRHLMSIGSPLQNELNFILAGNPNNPDGGFFQRFVGWYLPGIDVYFNGATPPDSPYPTAIYTVQYDLVANFPQYILNPLSVINSIMGAFCGAHCYLPIDLTAAIELPTSPGYDGLTTYYWIPMQNLPLVTPLRWYVPAPYGDAIADLLQPGLRVLVDLGYASGNYADIPTPAQFLQLPDPFTIIAALGEGAIQGATAFGVDLGWLPPSMMPTTYPFVPTLDPHLNFPIGQHSVTGVSRITGAEGQLMRSLALIPSWWD